MKAAKIALVIVVWAVLTNAVRMGDTRPLPQFLPLCGGKPPGLYDLAGIAVIIVFLRFLLTRPRDR
jgi:hypothetical protein